MKLRPPDYGQHVVFLGSTGSGKSYLAEKLLGYYDSFFLFDTQDSLNIKAKSIKTPDQLKFWLKVEKRIKYIPKFEFRNKYAMNYVFDVLSQESKKSKPKPKIIYIDEIYHLGYGASFPVRLPQSIATARQKKQSFWVCTQRPKMIPLQVLTESTYIFVFYLSRKEDIKYISEFARNSDGLFQDLSNQKNDFSFIRISVRDGTYEKFYKIN